MINPTNSFPDSFYIVLEGTNGCGKTTQAKNLYGYLSQKYPSKQVISTREPGGTPIAEAVRVVVQGTKFDEGMEPICEAYLYAASRSQALRKIVKPVLENKGIVISDRSFFTSLSFQAYGRELGLEKVLDINTPAIKGFMPNLVIYLKANPDEVRKRTFDHGGDKFETIEMAFIKRAESGMAEIENHEFFKDSWETISADGSIDEVFERIKQVVDVRLPF